VLAGHVLHPPENTHRFQEKSGKNPGPQAITRLLITKLEPNKRYSLEASYIEALQKDHFFDHHPNEECRNGHLPPFSCTEPSFLVIGLASKYPSNESTKPSSFPGTIFTQHHKWNKDLWAQITCLRDWMEDPFSLEIQPQDTQLVETLVRLAVNLVIFTGAFPEEISPEIIQRWSQLKNHRAGIYRPELVQPRTVGSLSYRTLAGSASSNETDPDHSNGLRPHWRVGHWKTQHFGPRYSKSRLIKAYHVGS
jgi:hypothetical protein